MIGGWNNWLVNKAGRQCAWLLDIDAHDEARIAIRMALKTKMSPIYAVVPHGASRARFEAAVATAGVTDRITVIDAPPDGPHALPGAEGLLKLPSASPATLDRIRPTLERYRPKVLIPYWGYNREERRGIERYLADLGYFTESAPWEWTGYFLPQNRPIIILGSHHCWYGD